MSGVGRVPCSAPVVGTRAPGLSPFGARLVPALRVSRLVALIAAVVASAGLLGPPSRASVLPPGGGESADYELTAPFGCPGAVSSPSKRSRASGAAADAAFRHAIVPVAGSVACHRILVGGTPTPALLRWYLAHSTSTSNP
jgi:hypothetical protein